MVKISLVMRREDFKHLKLTDEFFSLSNIFV